MSGAEARGSAHDTYLPPAATFPLSAETHDREGARMDTDHRLTQGDEAFEEDPRYRVSVKEAQVSVGYWVLFTIAMMGVAWGLGGNREPEEIDYIAGFPAWFFWSALVTTGIFSTVVPYLMVKYLFTDIPLEAEETRS
jgi:uncharacterized membrane protein YhdT